MMMFSSGSIFGRFLPSSLGSRSMGLRKGRTLGWWR
uniref:Uncharacterized protein n=1 Tax=Brassica oleracea TaxID=3712 RepID=A0A3P6EWM8_BRAOL|nr:unnamed protein product [Brassica oleracea]